VLDIIAEDTTADSISIEVMEDVQGETELQSTAQDEPVSETEPAPIPFDVSDYIGSEARQFELEGELQGEAVRSTASRHYLEEAGTCSMFLMTIKRYLRKFRWRLRDGLSAKAPGRLLDRDNAFYQCSGKLHINQVAHGRTQAQILSLYGDDWFHVVLSFSTWQLFLGMFIIYTIELLIFAGLYVALDRPGQFCGIAFAEGDAVSFQTAFAFSLITASTIGYGFPSSSQPFFSTCVSLVMVVYFQVLVSLCLNALIVGLTIQRLGRADSRSHQVVFSDKACIRAIHGHFYFMFQVYDLDRKHPVVEAHVRTYSVFHETDGVHTAHFQTRYMRLQNPNDELGGVLFLSVPCTVVHCIDQWSPLMPDSAVRETWENANDDFVHNASNRYVFPGIVLREADAECGDRTGTSCPICGETFPTDHHLLRHIRYMQWEEKQNGAKPLLLDMIDELMKQEPVHHAESEGEILPGGVRQGYRDYKNKLQNDNTDEKTEAAPLADHLVNTKHTSKVNQLLECYADLGLPVGHLDVDMNLLPTEIEIVPAKAYPQRNGVFSLFESGDEDQSEKPSVFKKFKPKKRSVENFRLAIEEHIRKSRMEIIVLVEGIEARSSNTFQARHSYTFENIEFDKFFAPAMEVSEYGHAQVNLSCFHQTIPVPAHVDEAEPVQSHT